MYNGKRETKKLRERRVNMIIYRNTNNTNCSQWRINKPTRQRTENKDWNERERKEKGREREKTENHPKRTGIIRYPVHRLPEFTRRFKYFGDIIHSLSALQMKRLAVGCPDSPDYTLARLFRCTVRLMWIDSVPFYVADVMAGAQYIYMSMCVYL